MLVAAGVVVWYLIVTVPIRTDLATLNKAVADLLRESGYREHFADLTPPPPTERPSFAAAIWAAIDPAEYAAAKQLRLVKRDREKCREQLARLSLTALCAAGGVLLLGVVGVAAIPAERKKTPEMDD
ncbi:MAG: hypothetical protein C4551_06490 [Bacillota bacterium]|jgi:hypothetical protein|nr:MAG: hypothetical protein C4551_06490 [Bacillota bacterium]